MKPQSPWVLRPLVPDEVYTDRAEFLDYFYQAALKAATRRTMSTVLLGKRRMGKTEIFKRVVNRLFWEQDHTDPQAVVPIYFSFPDEQINRLDFAIQYTENFVRWYAAFRLRQPDLLDTSQYQDRKALAEYISSAMPVSSHFAGALNLMQMTKEEQVNLPEQRALIVPRTVSDWEDSTIVMFLDEFQNTHLPEYQFRVVGFMQEAVESPTCPHFVTGSAMNILTREILGRGALFGRFDNERIHPLPEYWGAELALKAARYYEADVSEAIAPVLTERCGGSPFYITAVVRQASKSGTSLTTEDHLNEILAVDIASGFIWGELSDQVTRWISRINGHNITKWILYLSALEETDRLDLDRIQRELKAREGSVVSLDDIRDVLVKLSRGDLIEYLELGGAFRPVDDPILLEFLRVWGRIEVESQQRSQASYDLIAAYQKRERRFHEYKGYLAEVFMSQILLSGERKTFPGRLFHSAEPELTLPGPVIFLRHRSRLRSGKGQEIDLLSATAREVWVGQSKWLARPVGIDVLEGLLHQAALVKEDLDPAGMRLWLFAYSGLTQQAETLAADHQILWSSRADLNTLLESLGLRHLPEFERDEQPV